MSDPHDPLPDALDDALAGGPYLPDDGFTTRVLDGLPPPRRRRGRAWVPVFALLAVGLGVALVLGPGAGLVPALAVWLGGGAASLGAVPVAAVGALLALAATGVLVAFAD